MIRKRLPRALRDFFSHICAIAKSEKKTCFDAGKIGFCHCAAVLQAKVGGIWAGLFQEQISCQIVDIRKPWRATPGYEHRFKGYFFMITQSPLRIIIDLLTNKSI